MLTPLDPAALQALARPTEAELIEAATVIAMLRNGVECSTNAPDPAAVVRDLLAAANSWLQHGDAAVRERDALRAAVAAQWTEAAHRALDAADTLDAYGPDVVSTLEKLARGFEEEAKR